MCHLAENRVNIVYIYITDWYGAPSLPPPHNATAADISHWISLHLNSLFAGCFFFSFLFFVFTKINTVDGCMYDARSISEHVCLLCCDCGCGALNTNVYCFRSMKAFYHFRRDLMIIMLNAHNKYWCPELFLVIRLMKWKTSELNSLIQF